MGLLDRLRARSRSARPASPSTPSPTFAAAGYPKVGNTWLRFMLGRYLGLSYRLPESPMMDRAEYGALAAAGCRAIGEFTHAPLVWTGQTAHDLTHDNVVAPFEDSRVLLLVRHPLDTLVSFYMHVRHQRGSARFDGTLTDFFLDPVYGLDKLLKYYQLWDTAAHTHSTLHIWSYEAARASPAAELKAILEFLGEPVVDVLINQAVEDADFSRMQAIELSPEVPSYRSSGFPIFATGDKENPNARHVRRGLVGGYREELPARHVEMLERRVSTEMPARFGYAGFNQP